MEILNFIFGLGVAFSIFAFLWGLIMLGVNFLRGFVTDSAQGSRARQIQDYAFRIIKYFLLVSVTANYIIKYQNGFDGKDGEAGWTNLVLGVIVLGLYLMGKLQKRAMLNMISNHPIAGRFTVSIDPKVERYLLSGSLIYFIFCIQYPAMVDNGVVNWFTESIVSIYNTPVFGWIFAIIGFFVLVNIIFRGARVIGSLLSGQPINQPGPTGVFGQPGTNPFEQFRQKQEQREDFVDYEDVTEDEEEEGK